MRKAFISSFCCLCLACTGRIDGGAPEASAPAAAIPDPVATPIAPIDPEEPAGPPVFLPAGVRRLTQTEVRAAAAALLGVPATELSTALGTDARQAGFTRNADQRVDSVQADALWQAAQAVAHQAVTTRLDALAPCATTGGSEACAQTFVHTFAPRAFRRAVTAEEEAGLLTVFRAGASYAEGLELAITAVLQ